MKATTRCSKPAWNWSHSERGTGTKLVLVGSGQSVPLALTVASAASPSATRMIEPTLDKLTGHPRRAVMDKEFDSDRFRRPHRRARHRPIIPYRWWATERRYEDRRKLRRYRKRWVIERLFAWLGGRGDREGICIRRTSSGMITRMSDPVQSPPPSPKDSRHTISRNARYGMWLFVVYVIFYAGFVAISAFKFDAFRTRVAGVNLAIVYGLGLIVLAFLLALVYMAMTRNDGRPDDATAAAGSGAGGRAEGRA